MAQYWDFQVIAEVKEGVTVWKAGADNPGWFAGALEYVKSNPYSLGISLLSAISEEGWRQEQRQWMDEVDKKLDLIIAKLDRIISELAEIKWLVSALPRAIEEMMRGIEFSRVLAERNTLKLTLAGTAAKDLSVDQRRSLIDLLDRVTPQCNVIRTNWKWVSWPTYEIGFCVQAQLCELLAHSDPYYKRRLRVTIEDFIDWLTQGLDADVADSPAKRLRDLESMISTIRYNTRSIPGRIQLGYGHYVPGAMIPSPGQPGSKYKIAYCDVSGSLETGFACSEWNHTGWQDHESGAGSVLEVLLPYGKIPGGGDAWKNAIYDQWHQLMHVVKRESDKYQSAFSEAEKLRKTMALMVILRECLKRYLGAVTQ